jgi:hypothetical protein
VIGVRLIALAFLLLPSPVAAQFHDAPRSGEFSNLFQQCEAMGNADACRRALTYRMDPQSRDRLLQGLRNAEQSQRNRTLDLQLDQLLASCRSGIVADCDRAYALPLNNRGRSRVETARREAQMASERAAQQRSWAQIHADNAARAKADQQQRDAAARGVGIYSSASGTFAYHATFSRLCRGADYTVAVAWVATESQCRECYRSDVRCPDGTTHAVTSDISPFSTAIDAILYRYNDIIVWLAVLMVVAVAGISWMPKRNGDYLRAAVGLLLYIVVIFPQFAYATSIPGRGWYGIGSFLFGFTLIIVLPLTLWIFTKPFLAGCNYLFVLHPAEQVVKTALRAGQPLDGAALAAALAPDLHHLSTPPPVYHSENQAARARALREKLEADQALAEKAVRREEARVRAKEWTT